VRHRDGKSHHRWAPIGWAGYARGDLRGWRGDRGVAGEDSRGQRAGWCGGRGLAGQVRPLGRGVRGLGRGVRGGAALGARLGGESGFLGGVSWRGGGRPWDRGGRLDSYDLGQFPVLWHEWNGRYGDSMRDFWRSQKTGGTAEFATRFAGSSDLYGKGGRTPAASVNLITVHDGFTLRDLVSYDTKHNEANGEANRDGTSDNRSWNCGAEGPTPDPEVLALRAWQSRAILARCCCRSACRCCSAATSWAGPRPATITRTARTTRSPGTTGPPWTTACCRSPPAWWRSGARTRSSAGARS
jgi:hypothetical protein